ncbi:MAG: hypothetical protein ABFD62_13180 [Syntrophaceae bacterium]
MKYKRFLAASMFIVLPALLAGCGIQRTVAINQARYTPSFSTSQFSDYRGRQINLISFTNSAEKTDVFSYYSTGLKTAYTSQQAHLGSYFRSCFRDGFRRVGMRVLEDEAFPANIPEFKLTVTELNDMRFEFRVIVTRDGHTMLQKLYAVDMEPYSQTDPARLEKRAYAMVDKAITAVLMDPDFKKVWN